MRPSVDSVSAINLSSWTRRPTVRSATTLEVKVKNV
jgi:hypothetical protein